VNTYTGATTVNNGGTLALSGGGTIAQSSYVNLDTAGVGTNFDITQTTSGATILGLAGAAGTNVYLGSKALTVNDAVGRTYSGVISNAGGIAVGTDGSLTKTGTGTTTLLATNNNLPYKPNHEKPRIHCFPKPPYRPSTGRRQRFSCVSVFQ
jgi:hypothetical protein